MTRAAILLIECQNEWLAPNGKLRRLVQDESQLELSAQQIKEVLCFARQVDTLAVVHVTMRLHAGYPEFGRQSTAGLRKAIPTAGTWIIGEEGEKYYPAFAPQKDEFEVSGRVGASAFAGTNLDAYLRNNEIKTLYLTGYALHVCVESTLREAHDKGYDTTILSDATAAFTAQQKEHVLEEVVHHFGHHTTTKKFIHLFQS